MLTADLVRARRRGNELTLVGLDAEGRTRACALAERVLRETREHVGRSRDELEDTLGAIDVEVRDERLKGGLIKLVDDRCTFEVDVGAAGGDANGGGAGGPGGAVEPGDLTDPGELRRRVFLRASATRKALAPEARFDRGALMAAFAAEHGLTVDAVERGLYADLRGAHVLRSVEPIGAAALVEAWERGQGQAVLLRAVRVTVDVRCASPGATRALFHRLKFLRLLHTITRAEQGHRIVVDGPFSLFEAGTKYGLQLAMLLPMLEECESWSLVADVRWGAERTPLVFRMEGRASRATAKAPPLADDVAALVKSFKKVGTAWRVSPAKTVLDLPGVGLCVPDLTFEREASVVHLEVMGYWSRDAVWRRVELVQQGLVAPILFAVSSRLRVSEEVLPSDAQSGLYVYKGTMNGSAVAERIEVLAANAARRARAGG